MCGICGVIEERKPVDSGVVIAMRDRLRHRGPDDDGLYISPQGSPQVGLGFRRLAIIDLSGGRQPMSNEDDTIWIVFNGEIYNFRELRDELVARGHVFRTNSDTEAIIHAYEEFGEDCLQRFNGMFAFAIWDERRNTLFAARDRMGKKPFHYAELDGRFLFASEVKALLQDPNFDGRIDTEALTQYLAFEFVPAPRSIFEGVRKLPAGHWLSWQNGCVKVERYWDLHFAETTAKSVGVCAAELRDRLGSAVQRRLISDVPLGVFLSGGIDSSAIVALMAQSLPPAQIKTFAIGFDDPSFDESSYARLVARHFGTDHHEQILEPRRLVEILPEVVDFLDEPFGDASVVPTYLLSKFTREHVTVALGGDGGDELFAGYPTFPAERLARSYERLPRIVDASVRALAARLPVCMDNFSFDFRVKRFLAGVPHEWAERNQVWLGSFSPVAQGELLHAELRSQLNGADPLASLSELSRRCADADWLNRLVYFYCKSYLQDDILFKVDRASMAASLEVRAPFLDVEFVEFANTLPASMKLRGLQTKYVLKRALRGLVPAVILHRAKKGFGIPVAKWIRSELRDMVCDLLSPPKIRREGFFDEAVVTRLLQEHFDGVRDNRKQLWTLLMFEWWLERYGARGVCHSDTPRIAAATLSGRARSSA